MARARKSEPAQVVVCFVVVSLVYCSAVDRPDNVNISTTADGGNQTSFDNGNFEKTTPCNIPLPVTKEPISLADIVYGVLEGRRVQPEWISDNEIILRDKEGSIVQYNALENTTHKLVNSSTLRSLGSTSYRMSPDRQYLLIAVEKTSKYRHSFNAKYIIYNLHEGNWKDLVHPSSAEVGKGWFVQLAAWGRRGSQLTVVWNNNLYYYSSAEAAPAQVTSDGVPDVVFNGVADWVYEEEIFSSDKVLWFSPNGDKLCYAKINDSKVDIQPIVRYLSPSKAEDSRYPRVENLRYPKPGRPIPSIELFVVKSLPKVGENSTRSVVRVKPPPSILNEEYYVNLVSWAYDDALFVNFLHRPQNRTTLAFCSDKSREDADYKCVAVRTEQSSTAWVDYINISGVIGRSRHYYYIALPLIDSKEQLIHVAKINVQDGTREYLTEGPFNVISIQTYDEANNYVYYLATREGAPDEQHLYRVRDTTPTVKNKDLKCLTCDLIGPVASIGSGDKENSSIADECSFVDVHFSHSAAFYVRECLGPGIPWVAIVDSASHTVVNVIEANDKLRDLMANRAMPKERRYSVKLTDGYNATVSLLLPRDFCEAAPVEYPMLVHLYNGPESISVQKRFDIHWGHYLASTREIIYATMDVRGSSNQGARRIKELYKRLGTIEVADVLAVVRYLKRELPFIQQNNIALQGGSYGGYVTAMAIAADDNADPAFHCGISVAPVTNWMNYDAVYTERFLQLPTSNRLGYRSSDLTRQVMNIGENKRFLLIHGTLDDNVHYQQSMMLVHALIQNGIEFSSLTYPDQKHALAGVQAHLHLSMETFLDQCFSSSCTEYLATRADDNQSEPLNQTMDSIPKVLEAQHALNRTRSP